MKLKDRLTLGKPAEIQPMKWYIAWGFLSYFLLVLIAGTIFGLIFYNSDPNAANIERFRIPINFVAIAIATFVACWKFDKQHKRPMFYQEYRSLLWGLIWTTLLFQLLLGIPALLFLEEINNITVVVGAVIILSIFYPFIVWILLRSTVKSYWKNYNPKS